MNLYNTDIESIRPQVEKNVYPDKLPLSEGEKIQVIMKSFRNIMLTLGLDLEDDSLKDTPERVAKMFVCESFKGLEMKNFPQINLFENTYGYHQLVVEKNITVNSYCEHTLFPLLVRHM